MPELLSACMIVRNEARNLGGALASVQPWADEIIVVDTGSTDQTVAIARQYGATVYHFEWQDDFSAARNASIARAKGDWILWIDADERISAEHGRLLRLKLDALRSSTDIMSLSVRGVTPSCHTLAGKPSGCFALLKRVFRNGRGIRFRRRIFEDIALPCSNDSPGATLVAAELAIEHLGVQRTPSQFVAKQRRDQRLLGLELLHEGESAETYLGLAVCAFHLGEHDAALYAVDRCLKLSPPVRSADQAWLIYAQTEQLLRGNAAALSVCLDALAESREYAEIYLLKGLLAMESDDWSSAAENFEHAHALAEKRAAAYGLDQNGLAYRTGCNLGLVCLQLGRFQQAERHYRLATERYPDSVTAWQGRLTASYHGAGIESARRLLAEVETASLPWAGKQLVRAEAYLLESNFVAALERLKLVLSKEPDNGKVLLRKAEVLAQVGRHREAKRLVRQIKRLRLTARQA